MTEKTILDQILETKRDEVNDRKARTTKAELEEKIAAQPPARGFTQALANQAAAKEPGVIAEVKKASPSKGVIREDFDPVAIARSYADNGATCLSVLTDEHYFQGHDDYLIAVRDAVPLPVIRKDFVIDEYQIYESRALGADCILLIASALTIMQLTVFKQVAKGVGIDVLIEVHNLSELQAALSLAPGLVGINNRNLKTFETSLDTTTELLEHIPSKTTVVTESGISTSADVAKMQNHDVHCFLVGEAFMRAPDPGQALQQLFYGQN
ncbi:MAG: indole-3-glycerol phosphate synthase TrpC [Pseudomonadota bacterium]